MKNRKNSTKKQRTTKVYSIDIVKRNGRNTDIQNATPIVKPTNVEGHYPRFTLHGAINLLEEDIRELSIILESFISYLDKIGIQIHDTSNLIREIITGTQIFRRLKGISQVELLPFAFKQVPWFTRYTHSCLTYVLGNYVIDRLKQFSPFNKFSQNEIEAAKLCFLIHDIGHGPFSHLTERAFKKPRGLIGKIPKEYDHEYWTKILLNELKDVLFDINKNPYLKKKSLKEEKANISIFSKAYKILSKEKAGIFSQLLSSQIDLDRIANYLGDRVVVNGILQEEDVKKEEAVKLLSSVSETVDNIKRIINNITILEVNEKGGKCKPYIAINEDAVVPVIHYLFDRHIIRYYLLKHYRREAANNVLEKILLRAQYLVRNNLLDELGKSDLLISVWLFGSHTEAEFTEMNDELLFNQIKKWTKHTRDPVLRDLTMRFSANNFFCTYSSEKNNKPLKPSKEVIDNIKKKVIKSLKQTMRSSSFNNKAIEDYYFTYDETTSKPYHVNKEEILIYTSDKKIKKLSSYIKDTKNELGELLLNTQFERYLFIVPSEVQL